ncbi:MAG: hypothetical protein Q7S40_10350 [Opitutaceae bacterium]|nr:hypothetical protein [Opitutaceae bacterium]
MTTLKALSRFRIMMAAFIAGLLVSGLTAFPLLREMQLLASWLGLEGAASPAGHTGLAFWILTVKFGLADMYARYPWIAYGTDWLAFGHIVIALFFVGPLIRPAESRSVIYAGIAACILVFPLALIAGAIRGIPFYWRLIDCSFGAIGILPLLYCLRLLNHIQPKLPGNPSEPTTATSSDEHYTVIRKS